MEYVWWNVYGDDDEDKDYQSEGQTEETGGVRRSEEQKQTSPVNVRGARFHRYPLWTFGELAHITFDPDHAARSCAALRFHALPVHVRKGLKSKRFA